MVPIRRSLFSAATAATIMQQRNRMTCTESIRGGAGVPDPPQLLKVVVVFRHGARTPVFTSIPGLEDITWNVCTGAKTAELPAVNVTDHASPGGIGPRPALAANVAKQVNYALPGGCYAGQLSDLGIDQTVALGATLRGENGRYQADDPHAADLWVAVAVAVAVVVVVVVATDVRSTNVPRCVASLRGAEGLFPTHDATAAPFAMTTLHGADEYLAPNTAGRAPRGAVGAARESRYGVG